MSVFQSVAEQRKDDWVKPHSPLNIDELSALLLLREQLEIIELIPAAPGKATGVWRPLTIP